MKRYHIELLIFFFLVLAFLYGSIILFTSIKPAATPIVELPDKRNEWGQAPATLEELCNGTILQWSIRCTEIAHREQLRKDI